MDVKELLDKLEEKNKQAKEGGGPGKVKKQHESGKLTARERIDKLFDKGTFVELDRLKTHRCTDFGMAENKIPGDGVVTGYGYIHGRLAFVYAQDFTSFGGSLSLAHAEKICKVQDLAMRSGAPCIGMNDSGGARIQEGVMSLCGYGDIFLNNVMASGVVPQICAIMGPSAGGAVYSPALTDFIVMVKGKSHMVITGPGIIKAVTGEDISLEELGGAKVHSEITGTAHFVADSDEECIGVIKKLLSYLPSNNSESPPVVKISSQPKSLNSLMAAAMASGSSDTTIFLSN